MRSDLAAALAKSVDDVLAEALAPQRRAMAFDNPFGRHQPPPYERLQLAWLREQLARFTYKKGWHFEIHPTLLGGHVLIITFECVDTYNPDGPVIAIQKRVPMFGAPNGDPDPFAAWLAHEIQDVEIHESREWLKRDGKIYDDPHKIGG